MPLKSIIKNKYKYSLVINILQLLNYLHQSFWDFLKGDLCNVIDITVKKKKFIYWFKKFDRFSFLVEWYINLCGLFIAKSTLVEGQ